MWGNVLGAAGTIGSTFFSDRRLKQNILPIGGGWYEYEYIWGGDRRMGVMAQEVDPAAVTEVAGYLAVDYGRL
jgi:hypothetical protein